MGKKIRMRNKIPGGICKYSQILVVILFVISTFAYKANNIEDLTVDNGFLKVDSAYNYIEIEEEIEEPEEVIEEKIEQVVLKQEDSINTDDYVVLDTYYGTLTAYGPDCYGCISGMTSTGYRVSEVIDGYIQPAYRITYEDHEFGTVRVLAADGSIPNYSIIRIKIGDNTPIIGIVIDRGGGVGFGKFSTFDMLYETEAAATIVGTKHNVTFELLRNGN